MTKHVFLHFPPLPNQIKHNEQQTDPPSKFTHQGMQLQMRAGICLTYYGRARGHKHFRGFCGIIVTVLQTAEYFWNIWGVEAIGFRISWLSKQWLWCSTSQILNNQTTHVISELQWILDCKYLTFSYDMFPLYRITLIHHRFMKQLVGDRSTEIRHYPCYTICFLLTYGNPVLSSAVKCGPILDGGLTMEILLLDFIYVPSMLFTVVKHSGLGF